MKDAILVTGGAGYIGSHMCKTLAAAGYLPVTLDNLCTGKRDAVKWGPLIEGSVDDQECVQAAIKLHSIGAVIDMAGSIEVAESVSDPLKYYSNNFAQKIAFLHTLKECGVNALVFSSTAAVYGEPQHIPISESHPLQPKNPYGWSKMMYEQMLADFYRSGGIPYMALRYFNAAGASLDGDIGECHEPESHLIPRACFAALGKIQALDIFGDDYPTQDGTALRDYVHVMDIASAHVMAITALLNGAAPASYNLGNGIGTSIKEVLNCFDKIGYPVPHTYKPRRAGDPARLVSDASLAKKELGWTPKYDDINVIVNSAFAWHKKLFK